MNSECCSLLACTCRQLSERLPQTYYFPVNAFNVLNSMTISKNLSMVFWLGRKDPGQPELLDTIAIYAKKTVYLSKYAIK